MGQSFARARLSLFLILGASAALRVFAVIPPLMDGDEAWGGIAALNVLRGVFPFFFYGQPFMGGLEAYLEAPVLAVVGASRWSLKILPVLFGVLFVYLAYLLASRWFDRRTALLVTLAAACPSPIILKWVVSARLHYSLTPILGVLVFLVADAILARRGHAAPLRSFVLGLLMGVTWWHNYIGVIYLGAVVSLLLMLHFRRSLREGVAYIGPGFLLGSLPLWVYNAQTGRVFVTPRGAWAPWQDFGPNLLGFLRTGLPHLLGVPRPDGVALAWVLPAALILSAFLLGLGYALIRALRADPRHAIVPLVFLGMTGLVTVTVYGENAPDRYLFPLFAVIPSILGAGFGVIARASPFLGWTCAGALALINGWNSLDVHSALLHPERFRAFQAESAAEQELFQTLRSWELSHVYSEDYGELNFLSGGLLVFARTKREEPYPIFAELADGAIKGAYLSQGPSVRLEAGLAALGVRYEVHRIPPWWIYHRFRVPQVRYEEISPEGWAATSEESPETASHAFDRDIETMWRPRTSQRPGSTFLLDLRETHPIGMIAWVPRVHSDSPRGIEVATSIDGASWRPVVGVSPYYRPIYWSGTHPFLRLRRPRVEVRFPPTGARFIRLTQTGQDDVYTWSIRELSVYRPVFAPGDPDVTQLDAVAHLLSQREVTRVYGDHWVLSRLRVASRRALPVLPVSTYVDKHGRTDLYRHWEHPPDYRRPERLQLSRTAVVVLEGWVGTSAAFERTLEEAGYTFQRETRGEYLVYSRFVAPAMPTGPLPRAGWRVTASVAGEPAERAIDGDRSSRWSSVGAAPQTPGMWFMVDLDTPAVIGAIELDFEGSAQDYPRGLALAVSPDGERWEDVSPTITKVARLYWTGTHAIQGGVQRMVLRFPARSARFLRLRQTGTDLRYGWSIHELHVYPA